jgi:hypothetical protein
MSETTFYLGFGAFMVSAIVVLVCLCVLGQRADRRLREWVQERQQAERAEAERQRFCSGSWLAGERYTARHSVDAELIGAEAEAYLAAKGSRR